MGNFETSILHLNSLESKDLNKNSQFDATNEHNLNNIAKDFMSIAVNSVCCPICTAAITAQDTIRSHTDNYLKSTSRYSSY